MTKKFTEEQYNQIIETWDLQHTYELGTKAVIKMVNSFNGKFRYGQVEALALANEVTREWAHEQFVEKEKRYKWMLKTEHDIVISQSETYGDFYLDAAPADETNFTEKEIENSPFKPEYFDKEEA